MNILSLFLLCALLWDLSYQIFASTLYSSYNNRLRSVITYVENNADADDLARCLRTGERSEKYEALQRFLNGLVDNMELEYLYSSCPRRS